MVTYTSEDSPDLLKKTIQASFAQEGLGERFAAHVTVFCSGVSATAVRGAVIEQKDALPAGLVTVVESPTSFLCDLPRSLDLLDKNTSAAERDYVVLLRCGVLQKPRCLDFFADEIDSYDRAAYTACGFRLFPHARLSAPLAELEKRVHFEFYPETRPSRAVHVFTPDFCCLALSVLRSVAERQHGDFDVSSFPNVWCSFVITCELGLPIWQLKTQEHLDFSSIPAPSSSLVDSTIVDGASFEKFYNLAYDADWPKGVAEVHYSQEKLDAAVASRETCGEIWSRGFAGVNMLSDPASSFDFQAAASCGVRVVRIGAVGGAEDLMYLVDPSSDSEIQDRAHLLKVLPRLRRALSEIGQYGLKAIVTVVDLPGTLFFSHRDGTPMPFWESRELRLRATKFWGIMAENLVDLRHAIMGYDLINEPFTLEDQEVSFIEKTPLAHMDTLNQFYLDTLSEIRKYDTETAIIVNPLNYAMPNAMTTLRPIADPNVKYGIHCYHPYPLTLKRDTGLKYPGHVPLYPHCAHSEKVFIDKANLRQFFLENVVSWQEQHNVPSSQILVAEFGMCREVPGAQNYLEDVVDVFSEFGWSWLLFSFRDEEWDALDYELGPSKSNMLYRTNCELFRTVASHFR